MVIFIKSLDENEHLLLRNFGILRLNNFSGDVSELVRCKHVATMNQHFVDYAFEVAKIVFDVDQNNVIEIHTSKVVECIDYDDNEVAGKVNTVAHVIYKEFQKISDKSLIKDGPHLDFSTVKFREFPADARLRRQISLDDCKLLIANICNVDCKDVSITISK